MLKALDERSSGVFSLIPTLSISSYVTTQQSDQPGDGIYCSRSALYRRGWGRPLVKLLLGPPDRVISRAPNAPHEFWTIERVEAAEKTEVFDQRRSNIKGAPPPRRSEPGRTEPRRRERPPLTTRTPGPKWLSRFVRLVAVFGGTTDNAVLHDVLDRGRALFKSGYSASSAAYVVAGEQATVK